LAPIDIALGLYAHAAVAATNLAHLVFRGHLASTH
jgi:hypothetical protein